MIKIEKRESPELPSDLEARFPNEQQSKQEEKTNNAINKALFFNKYLM